jgi:endonuclease/exonuclease/phosphatase family metal-dependent hydrolase
VDERESVRWRAVPLRVITWNLLHGRALAPAGRSLLAEFTAALAGWEWDVALLQEVPPWWPSLLAERLDADSVQVLTSRNFGLPLRRAAAERWPDVIKSNGGGANAILVRGERVIAHRTLRLRLLPERRWLLAAELGSGTWVATLHASARRERRAREEARVAGRVVREWAGAAPIVLGGDFNVHSLGLEGFAFAGGHDADLIFLRGLVAAGAVEVLERGQLSDHAPVRISAR